MLVPLPEGDFQPGDMVELELPEASFSKASLLAYAFPLAMFLAGLLGASLFTRSEAIMALAAFAALGVSLLLLRLMEPRLRRNGKYMPAARKCAAAIPKKTSEEEL